MLIQESLKYSKAMDAQKIRSCTIGETLGSVRGGVGARLGVEVGEWSPEGRAILRLERSAFAFLGGEVARTSYTSPDLVETWKEAEVSPYPSDNYSWPELQRPRLHFSRSSLETAIMTL